MVEAKSQRCGDLGDAEIWISRLGKGLTMCWVVLCLVFVFFHRVEATVLEDLEIVADRVRSEAMGGRRAVDVVEVRESIARLQEDGSWSDIDYDDRSPTHWIPRAHLSRILNLARAYRTPGGALEGTAETRDAFLLALRYWTVRDPQSDNWFRQSIGSPSSLGDAAILMLGEIPSDLLEATGQLVRRSGFTRTGANLVWEASNLLTWACVTKDPDLLYEVVQHIGDEIRVTTEEGIQPDDSFHQHGPQNYLLGYGRSYASNVTDIAVLLSGTVFAFQEEKIRILSRLILDGQQWFVYGKQIDYHAMGREAFRGGPGRHSWNARGLAGICRNMRQADPARAAEYDALLARVSGSDPAGQSGPTGNKQFWRSDTMVHRAGDWYASVRFHSTRTYACEVRVNRENLQGYHLADGVMFLMQRGDEYHELQPIWDYRKLPGLTFINTEEPLPYGRHVPREGNTDFVGGVSDGTVGVAVMDFSKDNVHARKAYFFTDRGIVCLGSGISSSHPEPVLTTLNQCRLRSKVSVLRGGKAHVLGEAPVSGGDIQAVWHDDVAYVILDESAVSVTTGTQSGSWSRVEEKASTDLVSEDVFTCTINHGSKLSDASYAYRVVPGVSADGLAEVVGHTDVRVLANTAVLQAVHVVPDGLVQAVFLAPNSVALPEGGKLHVDIPCAIQVRMKDGQLALSIADPTQKAPQVIVSLEGHYNGQGAVYSQAENQTRVDIALPTGAHAGQSVVLSLSRQKP